MWPFKKKTPFDQDLPPVVAAALIISAVSLALSIGVMRWAWLLLDEQIRIRQEFAQMKNHQEQSDIQYEAWLTGVNKLWNEMQAKKK